jgi:hypothetical protein
MQWFSFPAKASGQVVESFFGAANVLAGNIATVAGTPPTACPKPGACGDGAAATLAHLET